MRTPAYTITTESITIIWGGKPYTVKKGAANFDSLRDAIEAEEWDNVPGFLTAGKKIESWSEGAFHVGSADVTYEGEKLPDALAKRIISMAGKSEDPTPLFRFWEKLAENPSYRSVEQLWGFLDHRGIPITEDGNFLAYKAVRSNYLDIHSGTVDNSIGSDHRMRRNLISDDPRTPCHKGFHVGALRYAQNFGSDSRRIVICEVDPKDVVCVPYDSSQEKMRVCRYKVIGNHGAKLPSTTITKDEIGVPAKPKPTRAKTGPTGQFAETTGTGGLVPEKPKAKTPKPKKTLSPDGKRRGVKGTPDPKIWAGFEKLDAEGLSNQSVDALRKYATYVLDIVGASKIRGGKPALVLRILEVRGG
jgi:hypothetical protein